MIALVQDIHRLFTREKMIKQVKFFNTWPSHVNCPFTTIILDELVAIKVINLNRIKDNVNKQMLQCQIQALKTINHGNVLKCYEVVKQKSFCYLITQYCNSGDLCDLLQKKKRFSQKQTLIFLKDIVAGFIQIANKGFLHRDLKLANILIHNNRAKVGDLGFAKKYKNSSEKEKYNVGSPLYMSPQALKKNIYSLKSDIWSIGIMTYELLHGITPWDCRTERQLKDKILRYPVYFRDSLNISQSTKKFIKKCLEINDKKRMSFEDLKAWLENTDYTEISQNLKYNPFKAKTQGKEIKTFFKKPSFQSEKLKLETTERTNTSEKQNFKRRFAENIPKTIVDKNNSLLIHEINHFRLLFKIFERMRNTFQEENQLINCVGEQILKRVTNLKKCCDEEDDTYGLISTQRYFDEKANPSIKKYKTVIREYYKKYKEEIKINQNFDKNSKLLIKKFLLKKGSLLRSQNQILMGFWMLQYLKVTKDTPKDQFDAIIDPKQKISKSELQNRINELY